MARRLAALGFVAGAAAACIPVPYQARRAPLGDPAWPAMRVEEVTTSDSATTPGLHHLNSGVYAAPAVTPGGLENRPVSDSDSADLAVLWNVRLQAGAGVAILDMTWSPASAPRCAGGHPALDILLDLDGSPNHWLAPSRQVHWERPVIVRGERVLSGRFDDDPELLLQPSVVDVRLVQLEGGGRRELCVRVPATGPDVTFWSERRWSLGLRVSFRSALRFTRDGTVTAGASLGRWFGPLRLGVEGIFGGNDSVWLGGFALEAGGVAWRWRQGWALAWSAGFEALVGGVETADLLGGPTVTRRASSGGPRIALQFVRAAPHVAGVSRWSPTSAAGLEVFASAPREWTGSAAGSPLTFGVSLLGF